MNQPSFMEQIEGKYGEKWVQKFHQLQCYHGSSLGQDLASWVQMNPNVRVQTMCAVHIPNSTDIVAGIFYLEKETQYGTNYGG